MKLKPFGVLVASIFCLSVAHQAQAIEAQSSEFADKAFIEEVQDFRADMYEKKESVCALNMRDLDQKYWREKYAIHDGYEDRYTTEWCHEMDTVLVGFARFLDLKWASYEHDGTFENHPNRKLKSFEYIIRIRNYGEFADTAERVARLMSAALSRLPDEFKDDDSEQDLVADLGDWLEALEEDRTFAMNQRESLDLAWNERFKDRSTPNLSFSGKW